MLGEEGWQGPVHQPRLAQHIGLPPTITTTQPQLQPQPQPPTQPQDTPDSEQVQLSHQAENRPGESDQPVPSEENKESEFNLVEAQEENQSLPQPPSAEPTENGTENVEKEKSSSNVAETDEVEEFKLKSLADFIPEGKFLFLPPSRYVFPGAEIYHDDSEDDEEDAEEEEEEEDEEEGEEEEDVEHNEDENQSIPVAVTVTQQTVSPPEEI